MTKLTNVQRSNRSLIDGFSRETEKSLHYRVPLVISLLIAMFYEERDRFIKSKGFQVTNNDKTITRSSKIHEEMMSRAYGVQTIKGIQTCRTKYVWKLVVNQCPKSNFLIGIIDKKNIATSGIYSFNKFYVMEVNEGNIHNKTGSMGSALIISSFESNIPHGLSMIDNNKLQSSDIIEISLLIDWWTQIQIHRNGIKVMEHVFGSLQESSYRLFVSTKVPGAQVTIISFRSYSADDD